MRLLTSGIATAVLLIGTASAVPASAVALEGTIANAGSPTAIPGKYIVQLKDNAAAVRERGVVAVARELALGHSGRIGHVYQHALRGFSVSMTEAQARRLAANPDVALVEQDQIAKLAEPAASWGLDRVDQRNLPLNGDFTAPNPGERVTVYIIDSGIRITHQDFQGRARYGWDIHDNDAVASDCLGHGTHVAGTAGGRSYGVAKAVRLVAVKVTGCSPDTPNGVVIAGVDWVTQNAVRPAVANMSLGGPASSAVDNAVRNSISSGITYALAAGNETTDACIKSPARTAEAITVGATTKLDSRAGFSNYGSCVDIFAPGQGITSAWNSSDAGTSTQDGTSMASPHAAGAAALILDANPGFTPQQVRDTMVSNATTGVLGGIGPGSPNRLLFTGASLANVYFALHDGPTGSGRSEVHVLHGSTSFRTFLGHHATSQPLMADQNVEWAFADANGDGRVDAFFVLHDGGTGSGRIEVHVLNGATNYTSFLGNYAGPATAALTADRNIDFAVGDANFDGRVDVFAILHDGPTGSGRVEVHVLNGATNYSTWLGNYTTPATLTHDRYIDFGVGDTNADGRADVFAILHDGPTGSGRIEVHVLNGATNYSTWLGNYAGPASATLTADENIEFAVAHANTDGRADVFAILHNGPTGSGMSEVHVLNGATNYSTWLGNYATPMTLTADTHIEWGAR